MSGWAKTGLVPFRPEVVLDQLKPSERPASSSSKGSSSAISEGDWRRIRHLIRTETADVVNEKLLCKYEAIAAENAILKHQLALANENIKIQKKRKVRGKTLVEEIRDEGEERAMWMSPKKIKCIRECQEEKDQIEQAKQTQKQQKSEERALNKALKEQQLQQRKAEQERKRLEKVEQEANRKAA